MVKLKAISDSPCLTIFNANHAQILKQNISSKGTEAGYKHFLIGLNIYPIP